MANPLYLTPELEKQGWTRHPGGGLIEPGGYQGSSMNAAQKAASLGTITTPQGTQTSAAEWLSDKDRWTDSGAYQNYMTGYQNINKEATKPATTVTTPPPQGYTQEQVQQMINNALAGVTGQYNALQSQLDTMKTKYDPQIQSLISQLTQSVQNMPTVNDIMNAPAMQQMQQAIQGQMDQQMKRARADLAARGMLGEGSTPAAERFGQVAQQAGQQLGSLIPAMMNTQQQMYQGQNQALQNLVNLLSGLDAQKWQQDITNLQTMLPYTQLTAAQQAQLPLDYFNTLMPWIAVTPAQQQNFITGILQSIGKVPGDADYNEWYGLIEEELAGMGKGGGL
jgi:hypothetical protein